MPLHIPKDRKLAEQLVHPSHLTCALNAHAGVEATLRSILAQRALPEKGTPDSVLNFYLSYFSLLDSNNFIQHSGAGEREGRVWSHLVQHRHSFLSHGIGRSGDLCADQPKAAGSTLLYKITNILVTDLLRSVCGLRAIAKALVVPLATGMTLSLVFSALRDCSLGKNSEINPRYVLWCRIDQKTCLKCIGYAGFEPYVVSLERATEKNSGHEQTQFFQSSAESVREALEHLFHSHGSKEIVLCVLTTTSCFAPRLPDPVLDIARVCSEFGVPHVVNNAYGLQSRIVSKRLEAAMRHGRVDAIISSTDKNFLVPVGGAVIASQNEGLLRKISEAYPGRASASPIVDVFLTLLGLGRVGYRSLLEDRDRLMKVFVGKLRNLAEELSEELYNHPENDISVVLTLRNLPDDNTRLELGSSLYHQCVSGPRVVIVNGQDKKVLGNTFQNYGAHHNNGEAPILCYPSYIAAACGIGTTEAEIEVFIERLRRSYLKLRQHKKDVPV